MCRRIKRDPRTARIPVVFVTALNDATDRVKAIEAGGDDFLTKPHNRLVLGARVRSLLKLKTATDALEESVRKLRELEKVRDDLLKMIVHDLKTPLTSVLATLELLLDGDFGALSSTQHQVVADAEAKAEDLLRLIEDLLEIAKLEETALPLVLIPIAPIALLTEVVHEWAVRFQQAAATATIDGAGDAPIFQADTLRLAVRREPVGVLFTVADNGPGIPSEYQELIFRKFEQVRTLNAPRVRSSGLGLAFCRLVVERHGGRIWVKSTEGEGSAFHILLPTQPRTAEYPAISP